jgi:dihydroorotase
LDACAAVSGVSHLLISASEAKLNTPEAVSLFKAHAAGHTTHFYPLGALSKPGETATSVLAELRSMSDAGALGFYEGNSLQHSGLMRFALEYSSNLGRPIVITPCDTEIAQNGVMTEGPTSTQLGLRGYPSAAEVVRLSRDLQLVERFGGSLHVTPVSTQASLDLIRGAKSRGVRVTCGTAPHYLWFCDEDIQDYDPNKKVMPPLPTRSDQQALIEGIQDGTIDCIASHHTPLGVDSKRTDFVTATPGISGLDTFLAATLTILFQQHRLEIKSIAKLISTTPNRIFGINSKGIAVNNRPSLTVIDLKNSKSLTPNDLQSKGKNSPFIDTPLIGFPVLTMVDGRIVWRSPDLT